MPFLGCGAHERLRKTQGVHCRPTNEISVRRKTTCPKCERHRAACARLANTPAPASCAETCISSLSRDGLTLGPRVWQWQRHPVSAPATQTARRLMQCVGAKRNNTRIHPSALDRTQSQGDEREGRAVPVLVLVPEICYSVQRTPRVSASRRSNSGFSAWAVAKHRSALAWKIHATVLGTSPKVFSRSPQTLFRWSLQHQNAEHSRKSFKDVECCDGQQRVHTS